MIENIKAVNNPLTIIAIFAALAEIAGTLALKIVAPELQATFVWFVMGFPALLVILFFLTLNFNPKVLYAPSDFRDEQNFLNTLGGVRQLSGDLTEVQNQLEAIKTQIIDETVKQIGVAGESQVARLSQIVDSRIESVKERVETTRESAKGIVDHLVPFPTSEAELRILRLFGGNVEQTLDNLVKETGMTNRQVIHVMNRLVGYGVIESKNDYAKDGSTIYKLRTVKNSQPLP